MIPGTPTLAGFVDYGLDLGLCPFQLGKRLDRGTHVVLEQTHKLGRIGLLCAVLRLRYGKKILVPAHLPELGQEDCLADAAQPVHRHVPDRPFLTSRNIRENSSNSVRLPARYGGSNPAPGLNGLACSYDLGAARSNLTSSPRRRHCPARDGAPSVPGIGPGGRS